MDDDPDGGHFSSDPEFKESLVTSLSAIAIHKVPISRKVLYALGTLPYAFTLNVIGFYFNVFLLDVALVDPLYVSAIVLTGRVWDAITDPIIGNLSLRTKTRLGRLRPWLLCSAIPGATVFFFLWYIPGEDWLMVHKFAYFFVLYLCFQALLTCYHVPYTALIMHVSQDFRERDSATFYRMSMDTFGILLGNVIYAVSIGVLADGPEKCVGGRKQRQGNTSGTEMAYWLGALGIAVLYIVMGLTSAIFTKEQEDQQKLNKTVSFFQGLKLTMRFRPYFYLVMMYMFGWIAVNFLQANFGLFVIHALNMPDHFQYVIVVLLTSMLLSMQAWQRLVLRRFGKKTSLFCGYMLYIPTVISISMLPMQEEDESQQDAWWKLTVVYVIAVINGFGISGMYLSAWSMLPDVIEESEIPYGVRREELFYAYFVFFTKFGAGVTIGISTAILKIGEYDVNKCKQNENTRLTLRMLMSVGPVVMLLISLIFLHYYPITEDRRKRTKLELENRKRDSGKARLLEDTPADNSLASAGDSATRTNEHVLDSGHYGSNGATEHEDVELSVSKL